jgi:gamma-glutamyl-gamma-aminobutyrate hydrolase PuuD
MTVDTKPAQKTTSVKAIQRDHKYDYPELWASVYVVGSEAHLFPRMLALAKCNKATSVQDADIVLFTGGADVSPELYGKEAHRSVYAYPEEDVRDILVFREAVQLGVPMVGVCRGAQFLHVANGGTLYQDVDKHNSSHNIWCKQDMKSVRASSVHHQMCVYQNSMSVLADAVESTYRWIDPVTQHQPPKNPTLPHEFDIEAFWYPETACLGFQGHPEYPGFEDYTRWCLEQINEYVVYNFEVRYFGNPAKQRLSKEIIDRRAWKEPKTFEPFLKEYA